MKRNLIYFNNAATSWPKPKLVIDNVNSSLNLPYLESGRSTIKSLINFPRITREKLADFFNMNDPENFQFTQNATDSLNILIHGYIKQLNNKESNKNLQTKRKLSHYNHNKIHVITTELEHNSVLRPLKTLEKEKKISLTVVPFDKYGYVKLSDIKKEIKKSTKLVVLNHGSNVLGSVQNIDSIGSYLHKKNIFFIVDGAQTVGHTKINLSNVDAFAFTGHKALFGFPGIGGFYIKNPDFFESTKQGGTGVFSQYEYQPEKMPLKFETGTHNYPGIVSLYNGIKFIEKVKLSNINLKLKKLTNYLISELSKIDNVIIYNKNPDLSIIAFNIDCLDNEDVGYILVKQYSIMTRTGLHCAPLVHKKLNNMKGCIRISLSYLSTMKECKIFIKAIKDICNNCK